MIGAISQVCDLPVTTASPVRPFALIQRSSRRPPRRARCCSAGRFCLGLGSGEALNEHILGDVWPTADVRLEMLEEAVEVIRKLWTGSDVTHHGKHYTVENARIYTLPATPPRIYVSGFGPKATDLAARIGDGVHRRRRRTRSCWTGSGKAKAGATAQAGFKVAWADTEDEGWDQHTGSGRTPACPASWRRCCPTVEHFEQASTLVTRDQTKESVTCGSDPGQHVKAYQPYIDAGFEEIYVANMGPHYAAMLKAYGRDVLPRLREAG